MIEPWPRLIAITDARRVGVADLAARLEPWLARALPGSVLVQLRDPELSGRARLALAQTLRALTRRYGQWLSVTDRLDLACLVAAEAVHLTEASVAPTRARALVAPRLQISAAWHPPAEPRPGCDALIVSPVLAARKGRAALGLAQLGALVRTASELVPAARVYALGGVDALSAGACVAAGAWGVAAISAVLDRADPEPLLRSLGCLRAPV